MESSSNNGTFVIVATIDSAYVFNKLIHYKYTAAAAAL